MLILVEGVPGAGKSSTARHLRDGLEADGRPVRWWSEEEVAHAVHLFKDDAELNQCIADLTAGRIEAVIQSALDHWQRFADGLRGTDTTAILDGCLSVYLTYTLLFYDVPEPVIAAYVNEVARIIAPCDPRLILLRPTDLARNLASVCAARGERWTNAHIGRTEKSPYGRRLGLQGFDGYIAFWVAHRELTDRLFSALPFPKTVVPGPAEDWPTTRALLADALPIVSEPARTDGPDLAQFAGRYIDETDGQESVYEVVREQDVLVLVGLLWFGERCRLVRRGPSSFNLESFPTTLTFDLDEQGQPQTMTLTGPDLLFGRSGAPRVFRRVGDAPRAAERT